MLIIILSLMLGVYLIKIPNNYKKYLYVAILAIFTVVTFGLGADYFSYEFLYEYITLGGKINNEIIEPLFAVFAQLLRIMGVEYHIYISILRIFILILTMKWINDNSDNILVSIILYFAMFYLVWTMSAIRQGIVLAIGLNLFFSKKELSAIKKILAVLALTTIHYSALYYLAVFLLLKIKWSRRLHLYFLTLSLSMTFIPLNIVVEKLTFIPYHDKLLRYLEYNNGFFDLASIMRLSFFFVIWFFYNQIKDMKNYKMLSDAFLSGISCYFIMKFSEIASSRFTIFTFVLIVILLPGVYENTIKVYLGENRGMSQSFIKYSSFIGLVIFSVLFLSKESLGYIDQSGYVGGKTIYSVEYINNKNYDVFDSSYSFRKSQVIKSDDYISNFKSQRDSMLVEDFDELNNYTFVFDDRYGKHGILSSTGGWLVEPSLNDNFSIVDSVIIKKYNEVLTGVEVYEDLSGKTEDQNDLRKTVADTRYKRAFDLVTSEEIEDLKFDDVIDNAKDFVPFPENISESSVYKVSQTGFEYHVVKFKYYGYNLNIYLDSQMKPFADIVFTNYRDYNDDNFLYATTYSGTLIFNSKGQLIWAV